MESTPSSAKTKNAGPLPTPIGTGDPTPTSASGERRPPFDELPFSKPIPLRDIGSALAGPAKLFVIFVILTLVLMMVVTMLPSSLVPKTSWSWSVAEQPLHKNAAFALHDGDALEYEINASNQRALLRLNAFKTDGCPGLELADAGSAQAVHGSLAAAQAAEPGVFEICVGSDGNEHAADCNGAAQGASANGNGAGNGSMPASCGQVLGSNLSFTNATWPYFQPWMLAVAENFSWNVDRLFTIQPANQTARTTLHYRTIGVMNVSGRKAYEVELTATPEAHPQPWAATVEGVGEGNATASNHMLMLIDAQARVLLFVQSNENSIRLVGAPFLNNSNSG